MPCHFADAMPPPPPLRHALLMRQRERAADESYAIGYAMLDMPRCCRFAAS
jgi:hypothetical protein